jgi:long-chain acyl-CoA synthetase
MLEYATYLGYLHKTDRTVHEQILFRLKGRSMPVTYHDVIDGRIEKRDTAQVRKDMMTAKGALKALGIERGDKIAMVGHNSTRYLTLDVAIGLVGAVNVPLYYTSPPAEIEQIVDASGSKVLLIGAPKILEKVDDLTMDIPIISFCRKAPDKTLSRTVISWEQFMAKGKGGEDLKTSPVGFGDLATCRYTSGTTGTPKGTCFSHGTLRWMGESLCSLLPWKTKNTGIHYMSFLPMNHVVEGILALYAPYYAPGPLNIYYLEDFRDLQKTITQVRPTLFFSVPRFYEKVWDGLMEKKAGKNYVKTPPGFKKNMMRRVIRNALLKKVGLDRCDQLIVGAAPMGEGLARDFSELGIEIHNAYGLTEAPLVTINRLGENRIGTVGKPLPNTKLRIGEDGEVLIRGPQVTQGYLDPSIEPPVRGGWLFTGDIGRVTKDGSLVIDGRKKELIVTSYGKNIHPTKIEAMLKKIPGVDEAMVVGDARPFCGAFLWVGGEEHDSRFVRNIEQSIVKINKELSHPEQLKRWAIMKNDLLIEKGDLTASLKLKRWDVMKSRSDVIEALYGGEKPDIEGLISMGRTEK